MDDSQKSGPIISPKSRKKITVGFVYRGSNAYNPSFMIHPHDEEKFIFTVFFNILDEEGNVQTLYGFTIIENDQKYQALDILPIIPSTYVDIVLSQTEDDKISLLCQNLDNSCDIYQYNGKKSSDETSQISKEIQTPPPESVTTPDTPNRKSKPLSELKLLSEKTPHREIRRFVKKSPYYIFDNIPLDIGLFVPDRNDPDKTVYSSKLRCDLPYEEIISAVKFSQGTFLCVEISPDFREKSDDTERKERHYYQIYYISEVTVMVSDVLKFKRYVIDFDQNRKYFFFLSYGKKKMFNLHRIKSSKISFHPL